MPRARPRRRRPGRRARCSAGATRALSRTVVAALRCGARCASVDVCGRGARYELRAARCRRLRRRRRLACRLRSSSSARRVPPAPTRAAPPARPPPQSAAPRRARRLRLVLPQIRERVRLSSFAALSSGSRSSACRARRCGAIGRRRRAAGRAPRWRRPSGARATASRVARLLGGQLAATAVRDAALPRRCAGRGGMNESKRSAPLSSSQRARAARADMRSRPGDLWRARTSRCDARDGFGRRRAPYRHRIRQFAARGAGGAS